MILIIQMFVEQLLVSDTVLMKGYRSGQDSEASAGWGQSLVQESD